MNRRNAIKNFGLGAGATMVSPTNFAVKSTRSKKSILKIAHITDIHIRPEENAPERFLKCIKEVKNHNIDFFLNGGDTIYAADYDNISRERVNEQWGIWNELRSRFKEFEVFSCLGNHDMWWAAPNKNDSMYGKGYAVEQLGIKNRFYSFSRKGWHFVVLDSNNENAGSLDEEQRKWLEKDLDSLNKDTPVVVLSHYPILGVCTIIDGGNHTDSKYITDLFYKHSDKKFHCLSGHVHLLDSAVYNNAHYYCNGAVSGFWWEKGDANSAQKYWYRETPPGYAILELMEDGTLINTYHTY
ncbi:metallophosphoesterase [Cytophaga sp. FL35]|uniref:metallophosphoesterase family protein n=1 Tax=Cytophaga sp. FL35 TaxID=1904456 RepID=UPI001653AD76|nr:metallophosphoesterase [Cytophaga sp. FL35]MBC6999054.1 metallophosphoesterase [Cytophaga sp. FL35]